MVLHYVFKDFSNRFAKFRDCLGTGANWLNPTTVCMYVCMGFMTLTTAKILCARSQDSFLSVLVRRVHVVFPTAGFKGGGKPFLRHVID